MKTYQVDKNGYYGEFGGAYVPEILHPVSYTHLTLPTTERV